MLDLYKNIKKYRIAIGLSQAELAQKTGYTDRSSIAKIEKGEVDLPQSKILLFAKALEVSAGTLMGDVICDSSSFTMSPLEKDIVIGYRQADPITKGHVRMMLKVKTPDETSSDSGVTAKETGRSAS